MSTRGELRPIGDLLPLMNEAYYEPQARPRYPILGARTDLIAAYETLSWPHEQDWTTGSLGVVLEPVRIGES